MWTSKSKTKKDQQSKQNSLTPAKVKGLADNSIVIAYRPEGDSARWVKYLISHDRIYQILLWSTLLFICPLAIAMLAAAEGTFAPGIRIAIILLLDPKFVAFLLPITVIFGGQLARIMFQPTHVICDDTGVWLYWQQLIGKKRRLLCDWTSLKRIEIKQDQKVTSKDKQKIVLVSDRNRNANGSATKSSFININGLTEVDGRDKLMRALSKWVPDIPRDPELVQALSPPEGHSYTEMWLAALSGPPSRERQAPLPPQTLLRQGKYKVSSKLASGGQGTAYVCSVEIRDDINFPQLQDRDTVVLKEYVLPVKVIRSEKMRSVEELQKEARILQNLDHPRVVKLLDFFVEDYRGYLVMEHIKGPSLRRHVEENGKCSMQEAIQIGLQMCDILICLHKQQPAVVHRDFTPENLILDENKTLKLIDFNVAKVSEDTVTATVVGKHAYLPPEQFRGKARPESDIYALGCTLHFLLTGIDPEPLSVSHPRELSPDVSSELDLIVSTCTSIEFKNRYASAADALMALTNCLGNENTEKEAEAPTRF